MAKNKSPMTVVTGKTLGNLIELQMSTQESLNRINAAMQASDDKKSADNQQIIVDLTRKLVDVSLDNFKLNNRNPFVKFALIRIIRVLRYKTKPSLSAT